MKKLTMTMSAPARRAGRGSCERCGDAVTPLEHMGYVAMPAVCAECVPKVRAEERATRRGRRLEGWAKRSGFPTAQLGDALRAGAKSHPHMALIDGRDVHGVYLHGETGTGKTTSALAYVYEEASDRLSERVEAGLPMVRYMTEERAFSRLSAQGHEGALTEMLECSVLILDEVGACDGSARARARYTDALIRRFADRGTTIIISNLSVGALYASPKAPVWDARMVERVMLMIGGGCAMIEMTEPHRQREMAGARMRVEAMLARMNGGQI